MKEFYKKHIDIIWYLLIAISVITGLFVDTRLGTLAVLLIGLHFYIGFADNMDEQFTQFDRFGASFTALLIHLLAYIGIIALVSYVIDKEEIKESNSYEVKFLENEKIVISKDNEIEIIQDAKLYWECRAKNCKNVVITNVIENPANTVFSKDLILKTSTVFSVN